MARPGAFYCELSGMVDAETISGVVIPCSLRSAPTRTIGLQGDTLRVVVARADWDAMLADAEAWDLSDPRMGVDLTFGYVGGDAQTLSGYTIRSMAPGGFGMPVPREADPTVGTNLLTIDLVTLPGLLRDKGALIRAQGVGGAFNPLGTNGLVDTDHDDYRSVSELVDLLLDAIGLAHDAAPASLDLAVDGVTEVVAPGPLDWGNADAFRELEGLLAQSGHAAIWTNTSRKISIVRLKRAGETITFPSLISSNLAEADDPADHLILSPSVRCSRIVVTSGGTRSAILTCRTLADGAAETPLEYGLEWVAFDDRTGRWLNQTDWASAYSGEIGCDDIDAWNAGPNSADGDQTRKEQYKRLYSAVGLRSAADVAEFGRFVQVSEPYSRTINGVAVQFAGVPAVAVVKCAQPIAPGQWINDPPLVDVAGDPVDPAYVIVPVVRALPGEVNADGTLSGGVFVLDPKRVYVRSGASGDVFSLASAEALNATDTFPGGDVLIYFWAEANLGDPGWDYYTSVWNVSVDAGVISIEKETDGTAIDEAVADPTVQKIAQPWLRRLLVWLDPNGSQPMVYPTEPEALNDEALDAAAEQMALVAAGDDLALTGTIPLWSIRGVQPGDAGGAVSDVTWEVSEAAALSRTMVGINAHEMAGSFYAQAQMAHGRRVIGGASAGAVARSSVDSVGPRAGTMRGAG